jgi:RecG-like helicase
MGIYTPSSLEEIIEAGIRRVLDAEREARESISRCEQEAARIVEQARHRAHRIAQRTDSRISAVRIQYENKIARQLATLRETAERQDESLAPGRAALERLEQAVAELAARLTEGER